MDTPTQANKEDIAAPRLRRRISRPDCPNIRRHRNSTLRKARNRPPTIPQPRTRPLTRHHPTRHLPKHPPTPTGTHHNSTGPRASPHHRVNTKEGNTATRAVRRNMRNMVNMGKYQALRRDSRRHTSTDSLPTLIARRRNNMEDSDIRRPQRMADSKEDILNINLPRRASTPLSRRTTRDHRCSTEVIPGMAVIRSTKGHSQKFE